MFLGLERILQFRCGPMPTNPLSPLQNFAKQALMLVGSVKMTVLVLVYGLMALAAGVDSAWFAVAMVLLAANLAAAVLKRMPLRRRQWSFLVVHAALISLLLGLWVSHHHGFEGELIVKEGEGTSDLRMHEHEILLTKDLLHPQIGTGHEHVLQRFALPQTSNLSAGILQEQTPQQLGIEITNVLANGFIDTEIVAARDGVGPGMEFEISGRGEVASSWLLADHPDHRHKDFGSIDVEVLNFRVQEDFDFQAQASPSSRGVSIDSIGSTERLFIPLPEGLHKKFDAGDGVHVIVRAFVEHARVDDGRLQDNPLAPSNPAAELWIERRGRSERHVVFSLFPEFGIHDLGDSAPLSGAIRLDSAHALSKPMLTLLCDPSRRLFTQVTNAEGRQRAVPLPQEDFTAIAGTPFTFTLKRFLSNATFRTEVREVLSSGEQGTALVQLRLTAGHAQSEFWLPLGERMLVPMLGPNVSLVYRRQVQQLPFRLGLEALNVSYYPGSNTAESVTSHVLVASADGSTSARSLVVSENQPLDYMGYRLLQKSHVASRDGLPGTAILSVAYDPGIPLLYASFILLILGVGWYVLSDGPANRKDRQRLTGGETIGHIEMVLSPTESPDDLDSGSESKQEAAVRQPQTTL